MLSNSIGWNHRRAAVVLSWAILLCACDGELPTGAETPPRLTRNPRAAELRLNITLSDIAGQSRLSLQGSLIPGRNTVTDETLEILGVPFMGRGPFAEGYREYTGTIDGLSDETFRQLVEVVAPTVEGVSPTRPVVYAAPLARQGDPRIEVELGTLPEIRVSEPVSPPPSSSRVEWVVEVRPDGGEARLIFGRGIPPRRIPIPELVLPGGVREPTTITLRYVVLPEFSELPDGTYLVQASLVVVIGWTVIPKAGP